MGGGIWTKSAFVNYSRTTGRTVKSDGTLHDGYSAQDIFKSTKLSNELNPYNVIRECRDSEEHPETLPVILGLDVTGSMGDGAAECAKKLNDIMTSLFGMVKDVEFMIMGIGDLAYDRSPIQISQFESDIRIAEQLDKVYFEAGGGGNRFESYTAAWYMGARHTELDCAKRGKKGIIITLGDERINPYLPCKELYDVTGDKIQSDVETRELFCEVSEKFDVYHLSVNDPKTSYLYDNGIDKSWLEYLDGQHYMVVTLDKLSQTIIDIISGAASSLSDGATVDQSGAIRW